MSDDFLNFMQGCFVNFAVRLMVLGGLFQAESYENTPNAYDLTIQRCRSFDHDLFRLQRII